MVELLWICGGGFAAFKSVRSGRDRHGGNDYWFGDPAAFLDAGHSHRIPAQEGVTIHNLLDAPAPRYTVQMWARLGYGPQIEPVPRRGLEVHIAQS